jgi:cytochrome b subunit of formate dehydrogenase
MNNLKTKRVEKVEKVKKIKKIKEKIFNVNNEFKCIKRENAGQGAAEYILLFGGVIVIAIAALVIYRSYFVDGQTSLNSSNDVNEVRNSMQSG